MRAEELGFLLLGAVLALAVWVGTRRMQPGFIRTNLRLLSIVLGLGVIVIPGHGEFIAVPILATLRPPQHPELLAFSGAFLLFWWAIALVIALLFGHFRKRR